MSLFGFLKLCLALPILTTCHTAVNSISAHMEKGDNLVRGGNKLRSYGSEQLPACEVKLSPQSAKSLAENIQYARYTFAYLSLFFNPSNGTSTFKYISTKDVIQPAKWIWTYNSPRVSVAYLSLPPHFAVLSMGLLDIYTFRAEMYFNVTGTTCGLQLGNTSTDQAIAQAIIREMDTALDEDTLLYSSWCYLAVRANYSKTLDYKLSVNLGMYGQGSEYRCCNGSKCVKYGSGNAWQDYLGASLTLAVLIFVFFPFVLMKCSAAILKTGRSITQPTPLEVRSGYREIPPVRNYGETSINPESLYFMDESSPITIMTLIMGMCGLANRYPVAVSRFRRFLFVILSPSLIYTRLVVWHYYATPHTYEQTLAFVDHDIPTSFLSMLTGYEKSKHLFLPYIGGPFMFLAWYTILGMIIIVFPRDLGAVLASGIYEKAGTRNSPLYLDIALIHKLSKTHYHNAQGYNTLYHRTTAHLYMVCNPKFWITVLQLQIQRWRCLIWTKLRMQCGSGSCLLLYTCVVMCAPFFLIYLLLCILEAFFCVLYYGVPILYFLITTIRGFNMCLRIQLERCMFRIKGKRTAEPLYCAVLRSCMGVVLVCFLLFLFSSMCMYSFNYIGLTSVFVYISALLYPADTIGLMVLGLALLYYGVALLSRIGNGYASLLADTINVSLELFNRCDVIEAYNSTLHISYADMAGVRRLKINTVVIDLTRDQVDSFHQQDTESKTIPYVQSVRNQIGISRQLFKYIVDMYRPVHVVVAQTIVQLVLIIALLCFSALIFHRFSHTTDMSGVLHVTALVGVGILPRVLALACGGNRAIEHKGFCMKLKATVQSYWKLMYFDVDYMATYNHYCESELE